MLAEIDLLDESDEEDLVGSKVKVYCQNILLPDKIQHPNADCFLLKCPDFDLKKDKKNL